MAAWFQLDSGLSPSVMRLRTQPGTPSIVRSTSVGTVVAFFSARRRLAATVLADWNSEPALGKTRDLLGCMRSSLGRGEATRVPYCSASRVSSSSKLTPTLNVPVFGRGTPSQRHIRPRPQEYTPMSRVSTCLEAAISR
ncbi:hypothetical protein D9M69_481850 [compost metagenome]